MLKRLFLTFLLVISMVFMFYGFVQAENQQIFNENLMIQLEQEGYDWNDLIEASLVATKFELPLRTILELKPNGYSWEQVEKALLEMDNARKIVSDPVKIKNNSVLSSLVDEGFSEKEIAVIVYIASLYDEDLKHLAKKAIKEMKERAKDKKKTSYFLRKFHLKIIHQMIICH